MTDRRRILHVYKDYPPVFGGIEHHVRDLAEAQSAGGDDVTVLVTATRGPTTITVEHGVRVIRARRQTTAASTPLSVALVRALAAARPDVTHLHSPYPLGEAAWLAFGRPPMVLSYHADIVRQRRLLRLWQPWQRRVLAGAGRILAASPAVAEGSPTLAAVRQKVALVPYGIDADRFVLSPAAVEAARRRLRPAAARGVVAFVGRLRYYKGLHVLVAALERMPDVHVVIVGTGPEGESLRAAAAAGGVADRIHWLGDVPDDELPAVLAAADVYCLPATAKSEAFGIAMLEAMAAGLPIVSTELGTGTSWVNQADVTGRVVPPGDAAALAAAIVGLMDAAGTRAALGAAARQRAVGTFSRPAMVAAVRAAYVAAAG
ncbi:MAG: glycosyltransferase [Ardenticatenales bacterium]|nr:glycosyltransferase [Ardenticatenales bacterium]